MGGNYIAADSVRTIFEACYDDDFIQHRFTYCRETCAASLVSEFDDDKSIINPTIL